MIDSRHRKNGRVGNAHRLKRIAVRHWSRLLFLCMVFTACRGPESLTLNDFETEADLDRLTWRCPYWLERSAEFKPSGSYGLLVEFPSGEYPTLELREIPKDWRSYRWFEAQIWAPDLAGQKMSIRMDDAGNCDAYADRFDTVIELTGRPQMVRLPLEQVMHGNGGRRLELGRMYRILFFLQQSEVRHRWYLDGVRLVR